MADANGWVTHNGFTISVWFRRSSISSQSQFLVHQSTQANVNQATAPEQQGRQLSIHMNGSASPYTAGSIGVRLINEGTATTVGTYVLNWNDTNGSYSSDDEWHNVVLRLSDNKKYVAIWIDGQVMYSANITTAVNWLPGVMAVGGVWVPNSGVQGAGLWTGGLSHVFITHQILSSTQVADLWAAGSGGTVYYGDDEVERLNRIFDWAEVPEQSRELAAAVSTLQGVDPADSPALDKAQETVEAVGGTLFADGQSRMVYQNRRHRYGRRSIMTLSEDTQSAPETDLVFTVDDTRIYNDITGSRPFGGKIRLVDQVSIGAFGRRNYTLTLAITNHEELRNAVAWLLSQYSRERLRISAVTFRAESSEKIARLATGLVQIGDVLTLDQLPDPSPVSTLEFVVEQIDVDANYVDRTWSVSYQLSPNELNNVAVLGTTYLGTGAVIGY